METLNNPLTIEEIKKRRNADNLINGVVSVNLYEMVKMDEEEFLDSISEKLTGVTTLQMVDYTVVGHSDEYTILIRVQGSVDRILEEHEMYGE